MSDSTSRWLVTTITSYILLGLFVASHLANPLIILDNTLSSAFLVASLAGLGITNFGAYKAVSINQQLAEEGIEL